MIACIWFLLSVVVSSSPSGIWNLNSVGYVSSDAFGLGKLLSWKMMWWQWPDRSRLSFSGSLSSHQEFGISVLTIFSWWKLLLVTAGDMAVTSWSICSIYELCDYYGTSGSVVKVKGREHTLVPHVMWMATVISRLILPHQSTSERKGFSFQRR